MGTGNHGRQEKNTAPTTLTRLVHKNLDSSGYGSGIRTSHPVAHRDVTRSPPAFRAPVLKHLATRRRALRVLRVEPVRRAARLVGRAPPLRDDAFEAHGLPLGEQRRPVAGNVVVEARPNSARLSTVLSSPLRRSSGRPRKSSPSSSRNIGHVGFLGEGDGGRTAGLLELQHPCEIRTKLQNFTIGTWKARYSVREKLDVIFYPLPIKSGAASIA